MILHQQCQGILWINMLEVNNWNYGCRKIFFSTYSKKKFSMILLNSICEQMNEIIDELNEALVAKVWKEM